MLIVKGFNTSKGVAKYDYDSLANAPEKLSEFENDILGSQRIAIPTHNWGLDSISGFYKCFIGNAEVTEDSIVDINLDLASLEIAEDCGLKSVTESQSGGFYIYAESTPSIEMTGTLIIQKGV